MRSPENNDKAAERERIRLLTEAGQACKRGTGRTAATDKLGELTLANCSAFARPPSAGYDAIDADGLRVQVKERAPRVERRLVVEVG
jgi:hypothetical protein